MRAGLPRLVLAGLGGDTGKSLVSLGLIGALRRRGLTVAPFKKGPDFIDAAWLGAAAGAPGRNLDSFIMPATAILASLWRWGRDADIVVVEGNRGLFDGLDARGSHSTAQLARLIDAPVVLVVDVTKVTRTVAALVLGCQALEPELALAGVILNRVGTRRQEAVIREAVAATTGLPVLGAMPRLGDEPLPSRHLGLVTSIEHPRAGEALATVAAAVEAHVDVGALIELAGRAGGEPPAEAAAVAAAMETADEAPAATGRVRIGVLEDRAFSFYYPENLEALVAAGAELVRVSPLEDSELPAIDGLYAGGGFPEVYADQLAANGAMRAALARRIDEGLPVWAECGGLIYLARAVVVDGTAHPMVGALPVVTEQTPRPQGHGYVVAEVDAANPFVPPGTVLKGHEFHYSRLREGRGELETVIRLQRGVGIGEGRDGLRLKNIVATYTHLHALGTPDWVAGVVRAAAGETS